MFLWDSANTAHIRKHDISPQEAEQVITSDPVDLGELYVRNGEERLTLLGETDGGRVLVVAITIRDEMIRVVTAYPANRAMRKIYAARKDQDESETSTSGSSTDA